MSWRMPPLALLKPVKWSPGIRVGMLALRFYLVLSAVLLLVKAIQLGGGWSRPASQSARAHAGQPASRRSLRKSS